MGTDDSVLPYPVEVFALGTYVVVSVGFIVYHFMYSHKVTSVLVNFVFYLK